MLTKSELKKLFASAETYTAASLQSIPEMVDELTRKEIATWYKDGKLTPHGRQMAKLLDRALPAEKVDEWGFLLTSLQGV